MQQPTSKNTQNLDLFRKYLDAGIMLIPCVGNTKIPARKGFLNTPFDPTINLSVRNYQALLSHRIVVIDVDKRSFKKGDKPLSRLCKDLQIPKDLFNKTFVVNTPSGGVHIYLSKMESLNIKASLKDYPGLEFKDKFIMAAGSYVDDPKKGVKGRYTIQSKGPDSLINCPEALLALLTREDKVDITGEGLVSNHPTMIRKYIQFLQTTEPAVSGENGDPRTFQVACIGKNWGLSKDTVLDLLATHFNPRCNPQWTHNELLIKVENAYAYGYLPVGAQSVENEFDELPKIEKPVKLTWDQYKDGRLRKSKHNLYQLLKKIPNALFKDMVQLNDFSHNIEFRTRPPWTKNGAHWEDHDAIQTAFYLSKHHQYEVSPKDVHEAVEVIASERRYHPVKDYLSGLKWDGVPRLDTWLHTYCGASKGRYSQFIGRKTLLAAVSRIYQPGIKFDHVLVLEGDQGVGKSLTIATLATPWCSDASIDLTDKDAVSLIQGHWIFELSEMDVLNKSGIRALKGFITRQVDKMRPPYARSIQEFPRQGIMMGTINPENEGYLRDPTGNRRFWPILIDRVDLVKLREDRDQLWAEALAYYHRNEPIHIDDRELEKLIQRETIKRQQEDPWFEVVDAYINQNFSDFVQEGEDICTVLPSDLYVNALGGNASKFTLYDASRIANILHRLNFTRKTDNNNNRTSKYTKKVSDLL